MPTRVKRVAAVVVVGVLVVGGCSSDKDTDTFEAKPSPGVSKPAEPAEPASPSPSPTGPLPKAKDGKDTGACKDGNCEILVTEPMDVVIGNGYLHVTVKYSTVTLMRFDSSGFLGYVSFGDGGEAAFSTAGGKETTVGATTVHKDGAVLKFSTK
ncbi:hypothetical protein [Streptomyces sp. DSM 40750]|uniref:hypothetical protein n=1 Tax=Streptomyces sp. DSM 40750 TaxID=2801030 RepID=UPI00214B7C2E|nr:hypothetical protein [Streptomyces sp. DSM 40750]UUU19147.1 hypothetical protein JIX55_01705 [Streptomyces sp. DSM 40750]UUU27509.1 hypothetical protein JIX55_49040 [Streptomyces sp. DSM 40750]